MTSKLKQVSFCVQDVKAKSKKQELEFKEDLDLAIGMSHSNASFFVKAWAIMHRVCSLEIDVVTSILP